MREMSSDPLLIPGQKCALDVFSTSFDRCRGLRIAAAARARGAFECAVSEEIWGVDAALSSQLVLTFVSRDRSGRLAWVASEPRRRSPSVVPGCYGV